MEPAPADPQSPPSDLSPRCVSPTGGGEDDKTRKRPAVPNQQEKRIANKVCRVCGDKAFSYNFNVITCESCKAFFRRNANKEKEIRCPFNEKCEINVVSRRFCQRCRLHKCFEVGMKKEWIMSEEARLEKKQRVEENRERRMQDSVHRKDPKEEKIHSQPSTSSGYVPPPRDVLDRSRIDLPSFSSPQCTPIESSSCDSYPSSFSAATPLSTASTPNPSQLTNNQLIAHAQLALQQAQHLQQTHQLAAAIQAMTPHGMAPPLPLVSSHVVNPTMPSTSQIISNDPSMITIPREMFEKLVKKMEKCTCTCVCGKYPPGTVISEEVTRELARERDDVRMEQTEQLHQQIHQQPQQQLTWTQPVNEHMMSSSITPSVAQALAMTTDDPLCDSFLRPQHTTLLIRSVDPEIGPLEIDDQLRLKDLLDANAVWNQPLETTDRRLHEESSPSKRMMLAMMTGAVKRMIRMSKSLAAMKRLHGTDQIKLIKSTYLDYLIIRGAMSYDPRLNAWKGPTSNFNYNIKLDAMNDGSADNMFENSIRLYSMFKEEYRTNESLMLLLGQICLFNEQVEGLMQVDIVRHEQHMYKRCLKRLMFSLLEKDTQRTHDEYNSLLDRLKTIHEMNRGAIAIMKEHSEELDPLLQELLNTTISG